MAKELATRSWSDVDVGYLTRLARRNSRFLIVAGTVGLLLGATVAFLRSPVYQSSVSFTETTGSAMRSPLAGLASQLGVSIPIGNSGQESPDFFAEMAVSRDVLESLLKDTVATGPNGAGRSTVLDLVQPGTEPVPQRMDQAVQTLRQKVVHADVARRSGIVTITVSSRTAAASRDIAEHLIRHLNAATVSTMRGQAYQERVFAESRLAAARADLSAAEDRLEGFLETNRQFESSPPLRFQFDRLQRQVTFAQQIVTTLAQALEEARIREARDTPVLSVVDAPYLPARPQPRRRAAIMLFGMLLGLAVGLALLLRRELGAAELVG